MAEVGNLHIGQARFHSDFQRQIGPSEIAAGARQRIEAGGGALHLFISQQAAHQFGARVGGFVFFDIFGLRQQQPRFDFDEHRRHQKIFGGKIELVRIHLRDVVQILLGDFHHRNIEHIDVLLADEIQKQIQRPLKAV